MAAKSSTRPWQPVDQTLGRHNIRLVQISSELKNDMMQCFHTHIALDKITDVHSAPTSTFTAVSYMWNQKPDPDPSSFDSGNSTELNLSSTRHILLNDQQIVIQNNLWLFLETAQDLYPGHYFWIDALCIDQDNVLEKGHQVQDIGLVFAYAKDVLIWLGCHRESEHFFHYMKAHEYWHGDELSANVGDKKLWKPFSELPTEVQDILQPWKGWIWNEVVRHGFAAWMDYGGVDSMKSQKFWEAFAALCAHPYFTRTWILQEVLLARKLRFLNGRYEISMSSLEVTYNVSRDEEIMHKHHYMIPKLSKSTVRFINYTRIAPLFSQYRRDFRSKAITTETNLVFAVFEWHEKSQCFDIRDRWYSSTWLVGVQDSFRVDYKEDVMSLFYRILSFGRRYEKFSRIPWAGFVRGVETLLNINPIDLRRGVGRMDGFMRLLVDSYEVTTADFLPCSCLFCQRFRRLSQKSSKPKAHKITRIRRGQPVRNRRGKHSIQKLVCRLDALGCEVSFVASTNSTITAKAGSSFRCFDIRSLRDSQGRRVHYRHQLFSIINDQSISSSKDPDQPESSLDGSEHHLGHVELYLQGQERKSFLPEMLEDSDEIMLEIKIPWTIVSSMRKLIIDSSLGLFFDKSAEITFRESELRLRMNGDTKVPAGLKSPLVVPKDN